MKEPLKPLSWADANQFYLMEALSDIRDKLEQYIEKYHIKVQNEMSDTGPKKDHKIPKKTTFDLNVPAAIETLCATFGLSPFEREIILLCAGMELDSSFPLLCAESQGDSSRKYPTFSLALAVLTEPHWSALTPAAPLRRWNLIEVKSGSSLISCPLQINERILHYLAGVQYLDERLAGFVQPLFFQKEHELVPSHRMIAERILLTWSQLASNMILPVIQLCGNETVIKKEIAASACAGLRLNLNAMDINFIPTDPNELDSLARLLERESVLGGSVLLLDCDNADFADQTRKNAIDKLIDNISSPLIVCNREKKVIRKSSVISFDVQKPKAGEQKEVWGYLLALKDKSAYDKIKMEELVSQFNFNPQRIRNACIEALSRFSQNENSIPQDMDNFHEETFHTLLWDACRIQARPQLDNLVMRIEPNAVWEDLVLPAAQKRTLREIETHVKQRYTVYENWGFSARSSRGLGITVLFAGASGTGKTMAAEVLAKELKLDLYRIDLSQVVSKYIGETEKNLSEIFNAAEEGGAILLFDEADALFGKRSEVRDSHDRYANIEVSYLLQRMEAYRGLAILTTNMKNALDPAFLRRIRFIVHFPFPDAEQRAEIWKRIFPQETPTQGLDISKLARLNVTGGNIYNIALSAAFMGADAGEPVGMKHILQATKAEYAKLEKPLTEAEIRGWI
jgi:hypothetical protein